MTQLTDEQARDRLTTLVRTPGELKLIRPWLIAELRTDPTDLRSRLAPIDQLYPELHATATDDERATRDALRADYPNILLRPSSFLTADIVRIEDHPTVAGYVLAITADESHVAGLPVDVLARCRQWEHEG